MTWHCITWHDTTQAITSHQMTWPPHQMTWHASKQVTSPPWNSRRLVHSKEMVWASRWSVALRTFYRQILSLLYNSSFFWNFRPRLARELLVYENISNLKRMGNQVSLHSWRCMLTLIICISSIYRHLMQTFGIQQVLYLLCILHPAIPRPAIA